MTKWEYLMIGADYDGPTPKVKWVNQIEIRDWKRGPSFMDYANRLGQQGWELVAHTASVAGGNMIFKRPVQG